MSRSARHFFIAMLFGALAASLFSITPLAAAEFQPEEGFTRLDNGKSLSGWRGSPIGWNVVDGAIHVDARTAKSHLYSEKLHSGNCLIRLEYRASPRADSGVFLWGKQFQVRDFPTAGPSAYAGAAKPAGEWNELEFDITNDVAKVKLNGQVIEESWPLGEQSKKGLGLQRERGEFDFRHLRLHEK